MARLSMAQADKKLKGSRSFACAKIQGLFGKFEGRYVQSKVKVAV